MSLPYQDVTRAALDCVYVQCLTWRSIWVTGKWIVVLYQLQQQLLHRHLTLSIFLQLACPNSFAEQPESQLPST